MAPRTGSTEWSDDDQARTIARLREAKKSVLEVAAADTGLPPKELTAAFDLIVAALEYPDDVGSHDAAFREAGGRAARAGASSEVVLDTYLSLNWAIWEAITEAGMVDHEVTVLVADRLMHSIDAGVSALAQGYIAVEMELVAAHSERRRSVLEDLLTARRRTPADRARVRSRAQRHGLKPDDSYRLILLLGPAIADDEARAEAVVRLGQLVRAPVSHRREGPGIRLPLVLEWRGQVLVLTRSGWPGETRLRKALPNGLGKDWIAVDIRQVDGIEPLDEAAVEAEYTMSVASQIGHRGWIADPSELALETAFLVDKPLSRSAIERELGPLLADERMGDVYIETLGAYLGSGQNTRETARRLHLAERTVTYRLQRIEELLGASLSSEAAMRMGAAVLALKVLREAGDS